MYLVYRISKLMAQKRFVGELFNSAGTLLTSQTIDTWDSTDCLTACIAAVGANNVSTYRVIDSWKTGAVENVHPAGSQAGVSNDTTGKGQISDKTVVQNQAFNNTGGTTDYNV